MSGGGGNPIKQIGGAYTGIMTGGAFNTNGSGWLQGGDWKSGITGMSKNADKISEGGNGMPMGQWTLSDQGGKLRKDLLLGNSLPQAATQSQDILNRQIANATAQGPTEQAKYLQQANQRGTMNALDANTAAAAAGLANASGQMAMRGGLDAGARGRLARDFGNTAMLGAQKIHNDAAGRDLDLLAKDEAQKTAQLQALPSSLLAQAGLHQDNKKFDISNTLNTVGGKYKDDMGAWAAGQSAKEQAALANKKQGLLGLGIAGIL
jgi:hypothetical protein